MQRRREQSTDLLAFPGPYVSADGVVDLAGSIARQLGGSGARRLGSSEARSLGGSSSGLGGSVARWLGGSAARRLGGSGAREPGSSSKRASEPSSQRANEQASLRAAEPRYNLLDGRAARNRQSCRADVARRGRGARRLLREKRIGHTGTLDPMASGVLPLVIGRATRLARFMTDTEKRYDAVVRLGVTTDSRDAMGAPQGVPFLRRVACARSGGACARPVSRHVPSAAAGVFREEGRRRTQLSARPRERRGRRRRGRAPLACLSPPRSPPTPSTSRPVRTTSSRCRSRVRQASTCDPLRMTSARHWAPAAT